MGIFGAYFFGNGDGEIVKDIMKEHKIAKEHKEVVEEQYKKFLEAVNDKIEAKKEN